MFAETRIQVVVTDSTLHSVLQGNTRLTQGKCTPIPPFFFMTVSTARLANLETLQSLAPPKTHAASVPQENILTLGRDRAHHAVHTMTQPPTRQHVFYALQESLQPALAALPAFQDITEQLQIFFILAIVLIHAWRVLTPWKEPQPAPPASQEKHRH
jgi:hypothetical protein